MRMGRRDEQERFGASSPTLYSPILDTLSPALASDTWKWTWKQIVKTGDLGMVPAGQTVRGTGRSAGCHVLWAECYVPLTVHMGTLLPGRWCQETGLRGVLRSSGWRPDEQDPTELMTRVLTILIISNKEQ